MTFSEALEALKEGKRVARNHWGGYWFLNKTPLTGLERREVKGEKVATAFSLQPTIVAKLKGGGYAPATPYQEDLLAEDWLIIRNG